MSCSVGGDRSAPRSGEAFLGSVAMLFSTDEADKVLGMPMFESPLESSFLSVMG